MPSDTASRASPRYRRTFGTVSKSVSSRQSRIASAISVGVISSSPASSATELTRAIAFRIRSAARPGIGRSSALGRLARADDDAALGLLADARARHVGVALEGKVDRPSLERLHRVQRDRVPGHLPLDRKPHRDLAHRVLASLAVSLDVDDDALAFGNVLANHHDGHALQRPPSSGPLT